MVSIEERTRTAHRFRRSVISSESNAIERDDVVDVVLADYRAPSVIEQMRGRPMVQIEGGPQALRRTVNARMEIAAGRITTVSVPSAFGAAILKAAAYLADSRDSGRHVEDAAVLLAAIDDPFVERRGLAGSDSSRLRVLEGALPEGAREWRRLPEPWRTQGQAALRILLA